jgi:hypothetical protein
MRQVWHTWWPLAASWALMGIELPAVSAVMARFPEPEINLAAYGGIVFPLALIIEAPIIMLLAASTALSRDWSSYLKLRRFMLWAGGGLTALHVLVTFTPLYHVVVRGIIGAPEEIADPARTGMMIMTPWTWAIAYRRFQQGVLIRFGHSRAVGAGTIVRLAANALVMTAGFLIGSYSGIVVGTAAVSTAVVCEALFVALWVRPILRKKLRPAPPVAEPLTLGAFLRFYVPLALTSLLHLLNLPIGAAALSRMPLAIASLAVWPVIAGLVFVLRAVGIAFNEVTVALLDKPRSVESLRRFTILLSASTSLLLLVIAATPLADLWFARVTALSPPLAAMAGVGAWISLLMPGLSVWQSWYQGIIVHGRRTRGIPEAVAIALVVSGTALVAGVLWGGMTGLYVGLTSALLGNLAQTVWLWVRSRSPLRQVEERERHLVSGPAAAADFMVR